MVRGTGRSEGTAFSYMTVELEDYDFGRFEIALAADERNRTSLIYDREMKTLTTDRTYSGLVHDCLCTRSMYVQPHGGKAVPTHSYG